MLVGGDGYDMQFLVIVDKITLKGMVLWDGDHCGITASSETLNIL